MNLDPLAVITTIIAALGFILGLYGTILSRRVDQRERRREQRRLYAYLEFFYMRGHYELVIVNTGLRPLTIIGVSMDILINEGESDEHWFPIEAGIMFDETGAGNPFPFTLEDGWARSLIVGNFMTAEWLTENGDKLRVLVHDAERNSYEAGTEHLYKLGHDPGA